ncbi:TPA: conjugal transfer protein TraJ [Klebsiella pneumoniae]|uniref:Conjugal transfer protein TraJ n=1 Tax=Klebsiella pneumoniae TaxID=573 RepID=A0A422ZH34_KLEPN|nr:MULTISPECIES: transcriptional regulator TraJ family protein [Enterobacteriaceae]EIV2296600.1 conjugal transfer protein TraJ [Klebsiella pneumoniae]RNO24274.1 conjugal transfer protein TraJ [Klebsiella pneumoniae]RNO31187.1 conjugal transfer protein TraJ [Klebsiella pneumoniae]RNO40232.1 conjugal transfer protein TraJ [Klebsiella pneumoniae]RNP09878.1 conjugal transfer protein TraJ [Klebsiella pneumoniae]
MYQMDRKEKDTCRQSLASSLEVLIMNYSFPVCIHDQSGDFPAFNAAFLHEFGGGLKSERKWEEFIGTETFLDMRELELMTQIQQSNFHIERCIYINGKQFDFMIEEFIINGCVCFLWKFGQATSSNKKIRRSLPLHADIISFMRAVRSLDKHEYDFLGFYAGGASHKIIGQFLGRENGSSRNKSSQILKKLNIGNRDDAFIVIHLSDLMEPIMKNVRDIIARNVNKLL